eukprot:3324808-Prymnesium_polylepis.1
MPTRLVIHNPTPLALCPPAPHTVPRSHHPPILYARAMPSDSFAARRKSSIASIARPAASSSRAS